MDTITRGTTPAVRIKLPAGLTANDLAECWFTAKQGREELFTKSLDEMFSSEDGNLIVKLTQAETLKIYSMTNLLIQVRALTLTGDAIASEIELTDAGEILKDGIISGDEPGPIPPAPEPVPSPYDHLMSLIIELDGRVSELIPEASALLKGDGAGGAAAAVAGVDYQAPISDLATIRSGAEAGATAVQPRDLAAVATSGSYDDLTGKPTIPSAVTESTVSGWGFTKNTGTYSKPESGIPKTDLASAVQASLGRADTLTDAYINGLIDAKLGVIENGSY